VSQVVFAGNDEAFQNRKERRKWKGCKRYLFKQPSRTSGLDGDSGRTVRWENENNLKTQRQHDFEVRDVSFDWRRLASWI
jgi:hypothetical protein